MLLQKHDPHARPTGLSEVQSGKRSFLHLLPALPSSYGPKARSPACEPAAARRRACPRIRRTESKCEPAHAPLGSRSVATEPIRSLLNPASNLSN